MERIPASRETPLLREFLKLFAFAHGFPDALALLPLAAALGYAYLRRRSYVTVVLVHFFFNSFNMAIALIALM